MNIYELKDFQAEQLVKVGELNDSTAQSAKEAAVRKHLKNFYEGRKIFDSSIVEGEKARYTALNMGGSGTTKYGRYCIVVEKEKAKEYKKLTFIKEDSAINYVDVDKGCLLLDKLKQDAANKECIDILAVIKHEDTLETVRADNWSKLVCNNSGNIEAVTPDNVLISHIKCVRMDKTIYKDIYMDSLLKAFSSELPEAEQYRLALVKKIFDELKKRGIELEIIDENKNDCDCAI